MVVNDLYSTRAGFLAIILNFASFWTVKVTSGIIMKVLGTVRTCGIIIYGVYMYNEQVTQQTLGGYVVTLLAFAAYTHLQINSRK